MMTRQDFFEEVMDRIPEYLPPEYANAEMFLSKQVKNNDIEMTGLLIRLPGETATPVIYLDSMYKQHEDGRPMEGILMEVADARKEASWEINNIDPSLMNSYSEVRDKLQIRLYDTRANRKKIDTLVHHTYGDLTACYCIVLRETQEKSMTVMVTPPMMENWGITKRQLHEDSIEADAMRGVLLFDICGVESMLLGDPEPENILENGNAVHRMDEVPKLMCLTTASKQFGAGLIIDPEIQERIAGICGGNYFILPSSVHEVLIVKDGDGLAKDASFLEGMVKEINATTVDPVDRLSDHVQYYVAGSRQFVNAMEYEKENRQIDPPARSMRI